VSQTAEKTRAADPGTGLGGSWNVIVRDDDHNTHQGVAIVLARFIPGVTVDAGLRIADKIHRTGLAIVWTGHKELAEHYWEQLQGAGLTMAPLEQN
jgi:ATP-dependent Clp protease adaptor protein ClpS